MDDFPSYITTPEQACRMFNIASDELAHWRECKARYKQLKRRMGKRRPGKYKLPSDYTPGAYEAARDYWFRHLAPAYRSLEAAYAASDVAVA